MQETHQSIGDYLLDCRWLEGYLLSYGFLAEESSSNHAKCDDSEISDAASHQT
jgi:hypothetical protein